MPRRGRTHTRMARGGGALAEFRLIGMVHLPPLPGSAFASMSMPAITAQAVSEAELLAKAGFDAVIVENFGDAPFAAEHVPQETIAAMAVVVGRIVEAVSVPVGVNVLRNDALAALSVAAITGARFIRVNVLSGTYATDQGLISGRAREVLDRRKRLGADVKIAADVHVKHAWPISQGGIDLAAEETADRAGADALIVSGEATGAPTDLDAVRRVRGAVPDRPIWIGSGVTVDSVDEYLRVADAVIVGTCLKRDGKTLSSLDHGRLAAFVKAAIHDNRKRRRTRV